MSDEQKIKLRAHELCKKYVANQYTINDRNKRIVLMLMDEFKINEDYAWKCFLDNNVK